MEKNWIKRMPNPIWIANTKPDCLAEAYPIVLRIENNVIAAVAYINEFILRDKVYYITRN